MLNTIKRQVIIVGDSAVGKTSLISQFANDSFNPNYKKTYGADHKTKRFGIDGVDYCLILWDQSDADDLKYDNALFKYRGCQCVLLVYDITVRKTFENINSWMDEILLMTNDDNEIYKILIGNKCDKPNERVVTEAEGRRLAEEYEILFFETSAKTNINVQAAFLAAVGDVGR